jgi:long-subunit acyl-CoA synthetase (AMP-forming)
VQVAPEDLAMVQYTTGTTDHPKGVELRHASLVANAIQSRHWYVGARDQAGVCWARSRSPHTGSPPV